LLGPGAAKFLGITRALGPISIGFAVALAKYWAFREAIPVLIPRVEENLRKLEKQ